MRNRIVNRSRLKNGLTNESQESYSLTPKHKTKHSANKVIAQVQDDSLLNKRSSIQIKEESYIFPKDAEHGLSYEKMIFETKRIHPHIILGSSINEN